MKHEVAPKPLSFIFSTLILFLTLALLYSSWLPAAQSSALIPALQDAGPSSQDVNKLVPGTLIKPSQVLHVDVELTLLNVVVTEPYNRLIVGLDPDNFRVFEDKVEQEIINFSSEDVPISIGVIFDAGGALTNKLGRARGGAMEFLRTANQEDGFFLVPFKNRAD